MTDLRRVLAPLRALTVLLWGVAASTAIAFDHDATAVLSVGALVGVGLWFVVQLDRAEP